MHGIVIYRIATFAADMDRRNNISTQGVLMDEKKLFIVFITILAITGFQVYWLRDSYFREKKALEIKTSGLFRETVREVQDSILQKKLTFTISDSSVKGLITKDTRLDFVREVRPDPRTAKVALLLSRKTLEDSAEKNNHERSPVLVTIRKRGDSAFKTKIDLPQLRPENIDEVVVMDAKSKDSLNFERELHKGVFDNTAPGAYRTRHDINTIFFNDEQGRQIRIRIDSLFADSVSIPQLTTEFAKTLKAEKMDVPFFISIRTKDSLAEIHEDEIGPRLPFGIFGKYNLTLGNTFPYLMRKITLPILFSLFLIGVTVLSFILLYRTLINQQRLAAMKNEFMSNITHELKTPIATVSVAIEALRNFGMAQSPEKTKEYLDISASELQRLGLLADKVLKLSMFENKEVELRKENLDLRELVNEVTNIMKLQFEKNNASVQVKTNGDDFRIEADRLHLTSVIYNLLDNALKYSREKPVIEIVLSALPNDIIELKVIDNGIGIPKEYKWKVFEKFFRVPTGNTHNIKGYGLGLSYVSEIIKRHMGFIEVESEPDKGATFTIKIPRREADLVQFDEKRKIRKKTINIGSMFKGKQA